MLSELLDKSTGHKAFYGFLDEGNLLSFFAFFIVIENFIALFFLGYFFLLLFLEINGFQGSYNTLSSSFDFLYDSDCCFHVGIKSGSFFNDFFFGQGSLLEVKKELFNNLISFFLIWVSIIFEISGYGHFNLLGPDSHLKKEFI